jgi:hypothetical protein
MRANAVAYTTTDVKPAAICRDRSSGNRRSALSVVQKSICFIETSDWDKEIIRHEKKLNRFCGLVIIVAVAYFLPVLISLLMK